MQPLICVCIAITAVAVIALFSKWSSGSGVGSRIERRISDLVKEGSRYATIADQDSNAFIATLHATYAHAYLSAAKLVLGNSASASFQDLGELAASAKRKQENAVRTLNTQHSVMPDSDAVSSTGWII